MRWREVPDEVLAQYIDAWLASHGAAPLGGSQPMLPPLEKGREANRRTLKTVHDKVTPLVRAWWGARNAAILLPWASPDGGFVEIRTQLDRAGVIDFQPLDSIFG